MEQDNGDLLSKIQHERQAELDAKLRLDYLVGEARKSGITWRVIASAAGLHPSAAHTRWSEAGKKYNRQQSRSRTAARQVLASQSETLTDQNERPDEVDPEQTAQLRPPSEAGPENVTEDHTRNDDQDLEQ